MNRRAGLAALILALLAASLFVATARAFRPAPARDLITIEVDENRRVVLRGNTRPEARPENDRGRVPDEFRLEHMLLQLRRPPELQQEFDAYVEGLTQGKSPNFHQWLAPGAVGERYGLSEFDLRRIERWLESHRIRVNFVYPNRVVMDISANAHEMREAFRVEIHNLEVRGEKHFANMNDPEIPEALAPAIVGIVSIHDFKPHPMFRPRVRPAFTDLNGDYAVVPADLAVIYNENPLFSQGITGAGQTIVVAEDSDPYNAPSGTVNPADWLSFVNEFKLAGYGGSVTVTNPNVSGQPVNCTDPSTVTGTDPEVSLDMEYATAAAPGAAIIVAACADTMTTFGGLIAIQNIIASDPHPFIISLSYGECEPALGAAANAMYNSAYQTAASEGISVFVAAGDQSGASCDASSESPQPPSSNGITVSGFASTPYNVAVGGTDFGDTAAGTNATYWSQSNSPALQSAKSYVPEIPWNDSCGSIVLVIYADTILGTDENPPYGPSGFCNNDGFGFQTIDGGSGGPSACATGAPAMATPGQVSGTCAGYPKPAWQSGLFGNPNDGVRDIPDVSLFAATGTWLHYYIFCDSNPVYMQPCTGTPNPPTNSWSGAGGTSFAAPIWAGFQALVNQRTAATTILPTPGQGNPNVVFYTIAKTEYGAGGNANCNSSTQPLPRRGVDTSCVFYDVTQGDNSVPCFFGDPNCFGADDLGDVGILSTGSITGLSFTGGAGYSSAPTCTISAPQNSAYNGYAGPIQATCTATIMGGAVTAVTLNIAGSGYAPLPICTLSGGGGNGATCSVTGITINDYEPAFPTTVGWDFATGIGTVNVYNLVFSPVWKEGP